VKISCPACTAKYSIGDDKVRDRLAKIRCRKCGATIVIDGKVDPPHVHTADGDGGTGVEEGTSAEAYSVDLGGGEPQNMTVAEIAAAYSAGTITAQTYVWADGFADWKPLGDVAELVGALHTAAAAPAAAPAPWDSPKAAGSIRAAARGGGRAAGGDLFGGYAAAGSEEEVTTSAPEPAPVPAGGVGARNESSVLFSLSALTASSPSNPAPSPAVAPRSSTTASAHDSGLIDLRAMAEQAPPPGAGPAVGVSPLAGGSPLGGSPLMASPLMSAPLGMASPLGGASAQAASIVIPDLPQRRSNVGLIVGVVGILVGIAAVIVVVSQSNKTPEPVAPAAPSVVYIEKTVTAPARDEDDEDAKPPSTGDTKEDEAPDAGAAKPKPTSGGTYRPRPRSTATSTATPRSTATAAPTATARPKPRGCGCPPGDLQCAMRCAAK
jgi:predicted Zn finger-like uncharacterized protein